MERLTTRHRRHKPNPSDINDLRNELCLKCGKYKDAHLGACDGCRWRKKEAGNEAD